ncbi:DEAD/DEAH box helicase family protein [Brachyspira intermedia]|uniref:DEAD/DEAH box helicase family protein n=1 Tax=Brachyspira intermedia TaxID=84377 RepID=UPI003007471E
MILQQKIKEEFGNKYIKEIEIPKSILNNIKYPLREYQKEALQYFILYTNKYGDIENQNKHLMFNMATGSGKTLIMASLILYLYEKGYRNFIFCVNLTNIIEKTKNNFFDYNSNKYLFKPNIKINNIDVNIKEAFYFDDDKYNINIFITTIQSLHSMFNEERENALTFEDLKDKEIVILADEAHHFNSETSKATSSSQSLMFDDENNYTPKTKSASWENTIKAILNLNKNNYLLEFTATLDYNNTNIKEKYEDKIIYKYDLIHFRKDLYSKEINILQNNVVNEYLMLGAVILSEYRREIANNNKINIKPVILFKSNQSVKQSLENQVIFNELIDNLTIKDIEMLEKSDEDNNDILNKAIKYFKNKYKNFDDFIIRIKEEFKIENQLTTNFDEEKKTKNNGNEYEENIKKMTVKEKKQLLLENKLLNTLENDDNPIRAIFSVNKLNEGWDVLNLFDIVRLYNFRDADYKKNKQGKSIFGKTTISEAQLIGRGARYYPIKLDIDGNDERTYKRKYDNDLDNDKRILETLYYHSQKNSKYIYEIKEALRDLGLIEQETYDNKEFMLKDKLKSFAKNNYVFSNSLEEKIKIYNGEKTFFGYKKHLMK